MNSTIIPSFSIYKSEELLSAVAAASQEIFAASIFSQNLKAVCHKSSPSTIFKDSLPQILKVADNAINWLETTLTKSLTN